MHPHDLSLSLSLTREMSKRSHNEAGASASAPDHHRHRLAMQLEPSLAPHAGLPGVDGTSRFCYGIVAAAGSGAGAPGQELPGTLAAAIKKAERAAAASPPAVAPAGGGLPVGPGVTMEALQAPAGTALAPGAPGAPVTGSDASGVGGTAAGFDQMTGAFSWTAVGEAKVAGKVAPA